MSQNIAKHNIIYHNMTQNSATYLSTAQHRKRSTIWREIAEDIGEQGWRSGESAGLPPMCPGFDSRTRRHRWVEFVRSLLCSETFFSGNSGFPLSSKTILWSNGKALNGACALIIRENTVTFQSETL